MPRIFNDNNMEIKRPIYLNRLVERIDNGMIKIVTGMRRSGKSYLLNNLFSDYLLSEGVSASNIIRIPLDNFEFRRFRDPEILYSYIKGNLDNHNMNFVIIDEIQMVNEFADVLNGLNSFPNTDIYVTGSNAKLLSKDIVTEFRGRGDEIKVYPLNFAEYMSVNSSSPSKGFDEFILFGSLPQIVKRKNEEQKVGLLKSILLETYVRDITERYHPKNENDLTELLAVLASSVGSLTNPTNLTNAFNSVKGSKLTYNTVKSYIDYFQDSFLIENAKRFDIKGKKYIDTPSKYYFSDLGIRNAILNFSQMDYGHQLENVIYNELKVRGYNIDVGMVSVRKKEDSGKMSRINLEVDFICNLGNKRYYIQSAYNLHDEDKIKQEENSLKHISDSYKKIIITHEDIHPRRTESGITYMSVYDFLLNRNSLEI